jgi:two-component SAPR family response regulator
VVDKLFNILVFSSKSCIQYGIAFNFNVQKLSYHLPTKGVFKIPELMKNILRIHDLGVIRVFIGEAEIAGWRTSKTRELLLFLAHQKEPVTMERIVENLWPEIEHKKAATYFHSTLYRLRQAIEKEIVVNTGKRYQLQPGIFSSDRCHFQELLALGFNSNLPGMEASSYLEAAVALYRNDYLSDLDFPWAIPEQEHLKHLHLEARLQLARYYIQRKDFIPAVEQLHMLLKLNQFHEEVHRLLMTAYAGLGNHLALNEQYQNLIQLLHDELGLTPAPETKELFQWLSGMGV